MLIAIFQGTAGRVLVSCGAPTFNVGDLVTIPINATLLGNRASGMLGQTYRIIRELPPTEEGVPCYWVAVP